VSSAPDERQTERVLLIPGLDGDPSLSMEAAPRLLPGLRVLELDHRRVPVQGGMDELVERAVAVLDSDPAGDGPAYVCGESFGGTVALTLARQHPERVRGLILLSTFGWYPTVSARASRVGLRLWNLLGDRHARTILHLWRPISVPGALGFRPPPTLAQLYLNRHSPHLPSYRQKCALSLSFDARSWLSEITCPTFILIGTWDPVVPTRAGRELARSLPNATLHCLPGGHLVHVVRAAEAGALITRWRRECHPEQLAPAARNSHPDTSPTCH
jgi:pimeloyl-ACP methyl ester carboxylesterase